MLPTKMQAYMDDLSIYIRRTSALSRKVATDYERFSNINNTFLSDTAFIMNTGMKFIPEIIINKRGKLDDLEKSVIALHPYFGYKIAIKNGCSDDMAECVLFHHKDDPEHLEEIPKPSSIVQEHRKILFSIDMYQALISTRSFRDAYNPIEAYTIMKNSENVNQEFLNFLKEVYIN